MLMMELLKKVLGNEKGQGMVEYGLILALIAVVVAVAMGAMGTGVSTLITTVTGKLATP